VAALQAGGFLTRTPLWYYILAKPTHGGSHHLGPVGSTIVSEVLIGLARRSKEPILTDGTMSENGAWVGCDAFVLIAARNPCRYGYHGDARRACT
jgi:hypothetical protein